MEAKKLVSNLKAKRAEPKKVNVTFRLPKEVIESFKAACERQEVLPSHVVEELLRDFATSLEKRSR